MSEGLIGQYGIDSVSVHDVQAMATATPTWHQPSARRGRAERRPMAAPMLEIAHRGFDQATRLSRQLESLHHGSAGGYRVGSIGDTWRPVFERAVAGGNTILRWDVPDAGRVE